MLKNAKKTPTYKNKNFFCEFCSFSCNKKSDYNRHILTYKHINATNAISNAIKKTPSIICCKICGKDFKHKSSLYRHKKTCKNEVSQLSKIIQNYPKVIQNKFVCKCGKSYKYSSGLCKHKTKCEYLQNESEKQSVNEIVPTNNVEHLLKDILEENKVLREKITNLELGNTMINSNNNFNINFFLNEKCKNAMNLEDFVEKIKFTLEDLQFTKDNGYAKGISNIFIKNLNDMDITERPIHCSDQKRLQFYVKNDNEWTKDKNNERIDNTIEKVSKKQIKSIQEWVEENPDFTESDVKMEEYFTLVRSITQPNDDKNLKNIKRKVGENVKLEKSENVK
jgi:hypothetical protein